MANGIEIILLYFGSIPILYKTKIKQVSKIKAIIPTILNLKNSFEIFLDISFKKKILSLVNILKSSNYIVFYSYVYRLFLKNIWKNIISSSYI